MAKSLALAAAIALGTIAAHATGASTPIDALERGAAVTVEGVVARIVDEDEFRLVDESGSVRVYVGPNWVPVNVGEAVRIDGRVDDDLGPLEIYARTVTRADGTVIVFDHEYK